MKLVATAVAAGVLYVVISQFARFDDQCRARGGVAVLGLFWYPACVQGVER